MPFCLDVSELFIHLFFPIVQNLFSFTDTENNAMHGVDTQKIIIQLNCFGRQT